MSTSDHAPSKGPTESHTAGSGDSVPGAHPPAGAEQSPQVGSHLAHVPMPVLDELTFTRRADGGYEPAEVDRLVTELKGVLEATEQERIALRADVAHLRDLVDDRGPNEIALDAVGLLSQAQVIADKCIADAETYARDLMLTARSQYREVLERAEKSAEEAARNAAAPAPGGAGEPAAVGPTAPVAEVEYVRTYARVAQVQLRAVLDALTEQVDKLVELPAELPKPARVVPDAAAAGSAPAPSGARSADAPGGLGSGVEDASQDAEWPQQRRSGRSASGGAASAAAAPERSSDGDQPAAEVRWEPDLVG